MDFSEALKLMKKGKNLFRDGWNGVVAGIEMYVYLVSGAEVDAGRNGIINPDPFFIFYHSKNKTSNFWVPSVWDLMADDWEILYGVK